MSNPFDHIKNLVEHYEVPYDPKAWANVASNLKPNSGLPTSKSWLKKVLITSGTAAVAVTTVILLTQNDGPKKSNLAEAKQSVHKSNNKKSTSTQTLNEEIVSEEQGIAENTIESNNVQVIESIKLPVQRQKTISQSSSEEAQLITASNYEDSPRTSDNRPLIVNLPVVADLCINEETTIKNTNAVALKVYHDQQLVLNIPPHTAVNFKAKQEGVYTLSSEQEVKEKTFVVHGNPKAYFEHTNQLIYQNGLPTLTAKTNEIGSKYHWMLDGKTISQQKEFDFYMFEKGEHELQLTVTNSFGCEHKESKTIYIEENYNLLAVNAFEPNNPNQKKNSFMPFALTVRDVKFQLTIIDPTNGNVVFESNDPTNAWTGIDRNTGQMVKSNTPYAWKVVILQPEKGEKQDYKGTVIKL